MKTLEEAKQHLRENWVKGTKCPCCNQNVKLYKRKMHSVMVRMLIKLYHLGEGAHHVREITKGISETGTNDFSKLLHWGMIQPVQNIDTSKRTSGYWSITDRGKMFVNGELANVPKYVKIYNGQRIGFSEEKTTIIMALGNKFNYQELMKIQ